MCISYSKIVMPTDFAASIKSVSNVSNGDYESFQSTRPRGARHYNKLLLGSGSVSIHAPAGGATFTKITNLTYVQFQSTRPRGARPGELLQLGLSLAVSIHAPAGGATVCVRIHLHQ